MTNDEHKQQLIRAHQRCQSGQITQKAYNQIERQIIRELKALNRQRYGHAMRQGGQL